MNERDFLIAARHIARGYLAERQGNPDLARVEFESALVVDRTSHEAILRLITDPAARILIPA